jgi:hypothetical protein
VLIGQSGSLDAAADGKGSPSLDFLIPRWDPSDSHFDSHQHGQGRMIHTGVD